MKKKRQSLGETKAPSSYSRQSIPASAKLLLLRFLKSTLNRNKQFRSSTFLIRLPPLITLFPYTTLFRSRSSSSSGPRGATPIDSGHCSPRRNSRGRLRSEEHTSELQSLTNLVCPLLHEKKTTISWRD